MHILFLTDNFPPEVNAPASRTYEHCREWVREGNRVTVVTTAPNFPSGKVFKGYRNKPWQQEWMDGIRVTRVWTYIAPNQGFVPRILDYSSFVFSSFLGSQFVRDADLVIGTSPQFFTVWAAYLVSCTHGLPFVFELRDLWPDSIVTVGAMRPGPATRLLEKVELFLYRKASLVVALTPAFKKNLIERGISAEKIKVIPNGVRLDFFVPGPKPVALEEAMGARGKVVVSYIGTVGMAHAVHRILEVCEFLKHEEKVLFMIVGGGAEWERIKEMAEARGLRNLRMVKTVPKDEVLNYYRMTDIFLVTLRDTPLFRTVIPSKIFEAMAMGLPIVCAVDGQCREIVVEEARAGLWVQPEDVEEMAQAVMRLVNSPGLRSSMGENGRQYVAGNYDRELLARKFLNALRELPGIKPGGEPCQI